MLIRLCMIYAAPRIDNVALECWKLLWMSLNLDSRYIVKYKQYDMLILYKNPSTLESRKKSGCSWFPQLRSLEWRWDQGSRPFFFLRFFLDLRRSEFGSYTVLLPKPFWVFYILFEIELCRKIVLDYLRLVLYCRYYHKMQIYWKHI